MNVVVPCFTRYMSSYEVVILSKAVGPTAAVAEPHHLFSSASDTSTSQVVNITVHEGNLSVL